MNLYEVVYYEEPDVIFLVSAPDFKAAIKEVQVNSSYGHKNAGPHVVHELGKENSYRNDPYPNKILRGPIRQPAYNFGWRSWHRRIEGSDYTDQWDEQPIEPK